MLIHYVIIMQNCYFCTAMQGYQYTYYIINGAKNVIIIIILSPVEIYFSEIIYDET